MVDITKLTKILNDNVNEFVSLVAEYKTKIVVLL